MPNDSVIKLIRAGTFDHQLTEVLRNGARTLLTQAIEAEVSEFLAKHADLKTPTAISASCVMGACPSARS